MSDINSFCSKHYVKAQLGRPVLRKFSSYEVLIKI